ncbi:hypothetical protein DOS62_06715 [Staphylococcus felis]|uniref:hypothetical protein n=1 Tax=Staphylococcus felis TaxID=46127 RepID=UPI000E256D2A|nr:hypothetical protein [Staphylococcus felis]REI04076.1 hypothetical protein DOS62_06715 [Staphylococcus felis]
MNIQKVVYNVDDGNPFLVVLNEEGESVYPDFEYTEKPVPGGIYQPIYFDVEKDEWIGSTKEEYESTLDPIEPSKKDKDLIISELTVQLAAQQLEIEKIKELTANVSLTLAQVQGGIISEL